MPEEPVTVLVLDDQEIVGLAEKMGFDASGQRVDDGVTFVLSTPVRVLVSSDVARAIEIFEEACGQIRNLCGPHLVILDLGMGKLRDALARRKLLSGLVRSASSWAGKDLSALIRSGDDDQIIGLLLAVELMRNRNWTGVIAVTASTRRETITKSLQKLGQLCPGRWFVDAGNNLIDDTTRVTNCAIQSYINQIQVETWYLHPPDGVPWFSMDYHDKSPRHLDAALSRFPSLARVPTDNVKNSAKKLLFAGEVPKRPSVSKPGNGDFLTADCIKDVLDQDLEFVSPIAGGTKLRLPMTPALPFLVAVKRFLNEVRKRNAPIQLLELALWPEGGEDVVFRSLVGLVTEPRRSASDVARLCSGGWGLLREGQLTDLLRMALIGKVALGQSQAGQPLASVFAGLELPKRDLPELPTAAWLTPQQVGILWVR